MLNGLKTIVIYETLNAKCTFNNFLSFFVKKSNSNS